MQKLKTTVKIHPENCAQCLSCMLICSFTHSKAFNPSKSYIRIDPGYFDEENWIPTNIRFLNTCKPNCWLCAQYCAYGALEYVGGK